jgi:hypothetical protein
MATKSQLKTYFEKGDIPTSTQFGELIDSLLSVPSEDTTDRPNQNLFFGNGEENPYMQGIRTISRANGNNVINMWIFTTHDANDAKLAIPMFVLARSSTTDPSLLHTTQTLRYCIPTKVNIDDFVTAALDCNTSADSELMDQIYAWEFKPFEKEDAGNHNILSVCTNINGIFSTFVFNLADINVEGNSKTLPIELMVTINNNEGLTVDGPYYIKNTTNENSFLVDWDALTLLLNKSYGTIIATNSVVVTRCNNIKNNYMEKH